MRRRHHMPFGAELAPGGGVRFRLWAPAALGVELLLRRPDQAQPRSFAMAPSGEGWFELSLPEAAAGWRYRYRIDGRSEVPDPASRYNPGDVHGESEVVDPMRFEWTDEGWKGRPWHEAVIYELHVGAFTPRGLFSGVESRLDYLRELGITMIELMPLADFPGRRNWGYDGVLPYAPDASYGEPDDLRRLVQAAHAAGMGVLLDVVYNHFGPEGNYLHQYAPQFFTDRHTTPWGQAINFDGAGSRTVRDFFIHNALYWLEEFHLDGLRFDAVHAIPDASHPDLLDELAQKLRQGPGADRHIHLVLENDLNQSSRLERQVHAAPRRYDAQWNDDLHHAFHAALTGESDGYYADYAGQPLSHLARCLGEGFAFQGEPSPFRGHAPRGEPSAGLTPLAFVSFLQNHDQIGNRAFGERITQLAEPAALNAALAIVLLAPSPPLLFMGEEFGAATPFLFFCDFGPELALAVAEGRRREFARFARFSDPAIMAAIPDPSSEDSFQRSRLDWSCLEISPHQQRLAACKRLLALRREHIMPLLGTEVLQPAEHHVVQGHGHGGGHGQGLCVRWRFAKGRELRLRANLGPAPLPIPMGLPAGPPEEQVIHATEAASLDADLPPWSVIWTASRGVSDVR